MPWNGGWELGVVEMDATHREFVELVDALQSSSDAAFPVLFARLREHTIRHFEDEKRQMKSCRFPAIGEHESEHLRVLGELMHFGRGVGVGRLLPARQYVAGLAQWFATHLATMDSALAACLKQKAGDRPDSAANVVAPGRPSQ